jgi:hypothetical protein
MAKRRIPAKLRATLGLIAITLAALWALSVSYEIPRAEMFRFLLGSVMMLTGAMLSAVLVVVVLKLTAVALRRLRR